MLAFTNVMHLFANKFPRLGAGGLPLALVAPGTFDDSLLRHGCSFLRERSPGALLRQIVKPPARKPRAAARPSISDFPRLQQVRKSEKSWLIARAFGGQGFNRNHLP